MRPIVLDGELIGGVYIESGLDELSERRRRLIGIIAIVLFGTLGVAFILSWKLQRLISSPILRLTEVTAWSRATGTTTSASRRAVRTRSAC